MVYTEPAERSLMLLARSCEQEMENKIAVLASRVEKLKTLRKDSTGEAVLGGSHGQPREIHHYAQAGT